MSLIPTSTVVSSTATRHLAWANAAETAWFVTYLGVRLVNRDQAVTAVTLAELVDAGASGPKHRDWPLLAGLASELGITADDAVRLIKES